MPISSVAQHLPSVFGVSEKTAIRHATTARQLLQTPIETLHDTDGSS